ncbi:MAG: hypothetical protein CMN30_31845 [Sandaracinus sp.]|nr:hypothetical protein [Sandaracinus sp.]
MSLVFVYGTLKRGYGNNRLLKGQRFISPARTVRPFLLTNCGFPYMIETTDKAYKHTPLPVTGEVWEADKQSLESMDALEGVSYGHYRRAYIPVSFVEGVRYCYTYLAGKNQSEGEKELEHTLCNTFVDLDGKESYVWM